MAMDPGSIVGLIASSASIIAGLKTLYNGYFGDETTRDSLKRFAERVKFIQGILQRAQARGLSDDLLPPGIYGTLTECENIIKRNTSAASTKNDARAVYQRGMLAVTQRLPELNIKLTQDIIDLGAAGHLHSAL